MFYNPVPKYWVFVHQCVPVSLWVFLAHQSLNWSFQKDAMQWSRNMSAPEELDDAVDAESSGSNETSTVSGDNDGQCLSSQILSFLSFLGQC